MIPEPDLYEAVTQHSSLLILLENHMSLASGNLNVTIMCPNDELSWLFTNRFRATRYMKVKRMGITEILRRIWLFSANKIKRSSSNSTHHCGT